MSEQRKRYIARKACGCIVGLVSYLPAGEAYAAREIAVWKAKGYRVERTDDPLIHRQYVGEAGCPHKAPQPVQLSLF